MSAAAGQSKSPTYRSWHGMMQRCNNPKHPYFRYYGGKGIEVCEAWRSFAGFLADMGERPPGKTLDRRNSAGHYDPMNCQWSTTGEQGLNRASTRKIRIEGQARTLSDWARLAGIPLTTFRRRLEEGWEPKRALDKDPEAQAPTEAFPRRFTVAPTYHGKKRIFKKSAK